MMIHRRVPLVALKPPVLFSERMKALEPLLTTRH